jgi:glutamate-5-semialdehyde dehydrogenase
LVLIRLVENLKSQKSQIKIGEGKDGIDNLQEDQHNALTDSIKELINLPDPINKIIHQRTTKNGMIARKIRTPIGTVLLKIESAPQLVASAAAMCIKTGNSLHIMPEKSILNTAEAFYTCVTEALAHENVALDIQLVEEETDADIVIPQGSITFVEKVKDEFSNVLAGHAGNNSIYVDSEADPYVAVETIADAKKENDDSSMENLLVHKDMAESFLPIVQNKLKDMEITLKGCPETKKWLEIDEATEADYKKAAKNNTVCVKQVADVQEAIAFINEYGNQHTESILSEDDENIKAFFHNIESSCIFKNASTRCNSAKGFGLGPSLGVSTQNNKGPIDMKALTSYKWIVDGNGQVID